MADILKTTDELKIENYFVDGDTRTITLKYPRADLTASDITSLETFMRQNNIIVGDKMGATFGRINKATKVTKDTLALDIDN